MYIQDPTAPLDTALATASSHFERVGSFRYLIADDRWEWSRMRLRGCTDISLGQSLPLPN